MVTRRAARGRRPGSRDGPSCRRRLDARRTRPRTTVGSSVHPRFPVASAGASAAPTSPVRTASLHPDGAGGPVDAPTLAATGDEQVRGSRA